MKNVTFVAVLMLSIFSACSSSQSDQKESSVKKLKIEKGPSLFGLRNHEEYVKKNLWFTARPVGKDRHYGYTYLVVGTPTQPYTGVPAFRLRLPDGTIVNTTQPDIVKLLQGKTAADSDATVGLVHDRANPPYQRWPEGTRQLNYGGWNFYVQKDRLLGLEVVLYAWGNSISAEKNGAIVWKGCLPGVGRSDDHLIYDLPLKQEEVIRVFGEPDKIRQFFQE